MYIRAVSTQLPSKVVTNEQLAVEFPHWDIAQVEQRTGVRQRHVVGENETALDLAAAACETLFKDCPGLREQIDGILFCTETPDYLIPSNACILQGRLALPQILALDINLACSGYVYLLSLAKGLLASEQASNLLLVTADTYSHHIHPQDRATRVLFGDGAAKDTNRKRDKKPFANNRTFTFITDTPKALAEALRAIKFVDAGIKRGRAVNKFLR